MSLERLSQQVDDFVAWKRVLIREITRYRGWLETNRLSSPALLTRLERALLRLRSDQITLAFVGEFSRGKTELINALFFSHYGQRMLPSQAGRTTMCPTELFFDSRAEQGYLRLLPIETRLGELSVAEHKRSSEGWLHLTLDPANPENMAQAFSQVAKVKALPVMQAMELGFHPHQLEPAEAERQVLVPAWRHALVNLDHPLLRNGLRVLDTPGLNALGCEPELTLSMLPNAEAVLFMLAADSGVTASDMMIWKQHIGQLDEDRPQRLFAVLNKIDVLWDDLDGSAHMSGEVERIRRLTAEQLGLDEHSVLPLSAKQALLAKVRGDVALFERSRLADLETLLCERIVAQKEQLLEGQVVGQILGLLTNSQQLLQQRLDKVLEQHYQLSERKGNNAQVLAGLSARVRVEHDLHHKRLLGLRTNQSLLQRQSELLRAALHVHRLEAHVQQVQHHLKSSWTTLGINRAILAFFSVLDADLDHLEREAAMANKMVAAIYERHNQEDPLHAVEAPSLRLQPYRRELQQLKEQADLFRLQIKTLLTEQRSLTRRFLTTLAQAVVDLHQRMREALEHWNAEALLPLLHYHRDRKQLLEQHLLELRTLSQDSHQAQVRGQILSRYAEQLGSQLSQANDMLRILRRPAPMLSRGKVVTLPSAQQSG